MDTDEPTFTEFKKDLLVWLYNVVKDDISYAIPNPLSYVDSLKVFFRKGWIRTALKGFEENGFVKFSEHIGGGADGGISSVRFLSNGVEEAERLIMEGWGHLQTPPDPLQILKDRGFIPASDREVSINHNSKDFLELEESFIEALDRIRGENAVPSEKIDEYQQYLLELNTGHTLLKAPSVKISLVSILIVSPLLWFVKEFASAAFAPHISNLLELVYSFFKFNN